MVRGLPDPQVLLLGGDFLLVDRNLFLRLLDLAHERVDFPRNLSQIFLIG